MTTINEVATAHPEWTVDAGEPPTLTDLGTPAPPRSWADWNDDGVVLLPRFFADAPLLDAYAAEWRSEHGYHDIRKHWHGPPTIDAERPEGWDDTCPYMHHDALRALCCHRGLGDVLSALTHDLMAVNLNLTGWVSTQRNWHCDSYLNEPEVGDRYAAVWIALDDIHPDSGVFQYVPGSHRWPQITRDTIGRFYDIEDPAWPKQSEQLLTDLFEREIAARDATVVDHVPKRGDVLIWHGRLLHRGSTPKREGAIRPALIAHFSGVNHRPRMPQARQHTTGGWYFPITTSRPVRAASEIHAGPPGP